MNIKLRLVQLGIFLIACMVIELVLRANGTKTGCYHPRFSPVDSVVSTQVHQADSNGISSYIPASEFLPVGYQINKQGFRSPINFTKEVVDSLRVATGKKVVLLVGDSYTEGCCVPVIDSSFADLLYQDGEYIILNFGVGASDLKQYELLVEHYVQELSPDLVVVAFFLGNDIAHNRRPKVPNVPICYQIQDYAWLDSSGPPHLMMNYPKNHFATAEEAYEFYLSNYTLWSEEANWFERGIRYSALLSYLYLSLDQSYHKLDWLVNHYEKGMFVAITNSLLKKMEASAKAHQAKFLVVGIPSPMDVKKERKLEEVYGEYFDGVTHAFPSIELLSEKDYDGLTVSNHFNESGHRKWFHYVNQEIGAVFAGE